MAVMGVKVIEEFDSELFAKKCKEFLSENEDLLHHKQTTFGVTTHTWQDDELIALNLKISRDYHFFDIFFLRSFRRIQL